MDKQTLIRRRDSLKAALTIQENVLSNFIIYSLDDYNQLVLRFEHITSIYPRFDDAQTEIELLEGEEDIDMTERENFEGRFFKIMAKCKTLLQESRFNPDIQVFQGIQQPSFLPQDSHCTQHESIKLPEIKLPIFDGNMTKWRYFRDLVSELIINNPSLKDSSKFFHLNSCLAPNLQQALANIPQSASNFSVAWRFLTSRYDNPRLQVNAHVDQIFNPPQYTPGSASSLRSLVDHVKANLASLHSLRLSVSLEDLFVQRIILDQLDVETLKIWEQQSSVDSVPTLDDLLNFIEQRARVLDVNPPNQPPPQRIMPTKFASIPRTPFNRTYNLPNKCIFCGQGHLNHQCPKFFNMSLADRKDKVDQFRLCNNCLRVGTPNHRCSFLNCWKCGQSHHTLLHPNPSSGDRQSLSRQSAPSTTGSRQPYFSSRSSTSCNKDRRDDSSRASSSFQSSTRVTSATTSSSDPSRCCLLATAIILVTNENGVPIKCRALLDGGSDCNLMTFACKDRLNLSTCSTNVNVSGLCLASHNVSRSVDVSLKSTHSDFHADIKCLLVPHITSDLPLVNIDISTWHLPTELAYADPEFYLSKPIDMLIGAELFFDLLLPGRLSPGRELPHLQNTCLGWVLAGSTPPNPSSSGTS